MTQESSRTTKRASSKKKKTSAHDDTSVPSVEDILKDASASRPRRSKIASWERDNPTEAKRFWDAIDACRERGGSVEAVLAVCQARLGGPPGSVSTVRTAIHERDAKNLRLDD